MNTWLEAQFSLKGKRALVTGASKGIGAEIAIDLSRAGAEVILLGRTEISLSSTVQTISKDRKSTRLNSSHVSESRMPSSA